MGGNRSLEAAVTSGNLMGGNRSLEAAVKQWVEPNNVKEVAEEDTAVLIVGNKSDLCTSNSVRAVKASDGMRLAEECNGLFFETSVKDNVSISEAMAALAGRLQEKEDLSIERALQLHLQTRKRRCCS